MKSFHHLSILTLFGTLCQAGSLFHTVRFLTDGKITKFTSTTQGSAMQNAHYGTSLTTPSNTRRALDYLEDIWFKPEGEWRAVSPPCCRNDELHVVGAEKYIGGILPEGNFTVSYEPIQGSDNWTRSWRFESTKSSSYNSGPQVLLPEIPDTPLIFRNVSIFLEINPQEDAKIQPVRFHDITIEAITKHTGWCTDPLIMAPQNGTFGLKMTTPVATIQGEKVVCTVGSLVYS